MAHPLLIQDVARVDKATQPLEEISTKDAIEQLVGGIVESTSECTSKVVGVRIEPSLHAAPGKFIHRRTRGVVHPMVGAVHQAYQDHRPIVLSPDMFWLLVTQGLALHINNNPNEFRDRFCVGQVRQVIEVRRDDLYKGSPENPWEEVFDDFCQKIQIKIGQDNFSRIVASYSTTGRAERAANAIALMDCVKSYFQYSLFSRCGIPQVILEGTVTDWESLRDNTEAIGKTYGLTWWTQRLLPVLDRVARNAGGKDDPELWQAFYKVVGGSGGPYISGWIADFFPYVGSGQPKNRNPAFQEGPLPTAWEQSPWDWCITTSVLPSPLSKVPFKWAYQDKEFRMELLAGFVGFTQDRETLQLRPKIGWAVRDAK